MQGTIKTFKTNSQNYRVLEYLKSGEKLTCLDAMQKGLTHNLRSRISDLKRAGYQIESKQINTSDSYVAEYSLVL